jgi:dipeptidyl aminopeptidase/acylaminoacyl peptidase
MNRKNIVNIFIVTFFLISCGPAALLKATPLPVFKTSEISGQVVYCALVSADPYISQVFLKNLNTGTMKQLTDSGDNCYPRWSPDGSKIVYLSGSKENYWDIYLMNKDGSNQRPLVATASLEYMTDWSPDGSKIAFVSNIEGKQNIYAINIDTLTIVKLTNNSINGRFPNWSSDGKQIAFISDSFNYGRNETPVVLLMNSDGTNIRQLMEPSQDGFDLTPIWCPDDSCIIFTRSDTHKYEFFSFGLENIISTPFLNDFFMPETYKELLGRSPVRGYLTFIADKNSYVMDMKTNEIFSLDIETNAFSLYP